jgi:FKBP12-rapamycin complex-associated protein
MAVFARIAHHDSLHIMPVVRLTLERLIKQVQHSKDQQLRQESVQLLQAIVRGANTLIVPYVEQIFQPLMMMLLNESSTLVVGSTLSTIGELAVASPAIVQKHCDKLFPRLTLALNDSTSLTLREIAVVAIGKVMSSIALLLNEPYTKFPDLFDGIVRAIQTETDENSVLQLQAMRTVGLLGSVDPSLYEIHKQADNLKTDSKTLKPDHFDDLATANDSITASVTNDSPLHEKRMTKIEKYYFSVIMRELLDTLLDVSLSVHHQTVLSIVTKAVSHVGYQAFPFIRDYIMNGIIVRIYQKDTNSTMREFLLDHLSTLIMLVGRQMQYYATTIIQVINEFFNEYLYQCLDLLEATYSTFLLHDFLMVLRDCLPCLLKVLPDEIAEESKLKDEPSSSSAMNGTRDTKTSTLPAKRLLRLVKTQRLMQSIVNMKDKLIEYRYQQLMPLVIHVFDSNLVAIDTRKFAVAVLVELSLEADMSEQIAKLIHPLIRLISSSAQEISLFETGMAALSFFLCKLGNEYLPFVLPVKRALPSHIQAKLPDSKTGHLMTQPAAPTRETALVQLAEYEVLVMQLLRQNPLPTEPSDMSDITVRKLTKILPRPVSDNSQGLNMQALEASWGLINCDSPSDLSDWLQRLCTEFIRQAPSPIIRMCTPLVKANRVSAEQLFNASFNCMWETLYYGDSTDVIDDIPLISAIETALSSSHVPRDVVVCLLDVAEFMDMQDKRLPIDVSLLSKQAESVNMFARTLRYREIEFNSPNCIPSSECVEALITVNNELGLEDKATGVLLYVASNCPAIEVKPLWLEKLLYWNDARQSYLQQKISFREAYPNDSPVWNADWMACELGEMRCLHALGEYEELVDGAQALKQQLDAAGDVDISQSWIHDVNILGASAAWNLGRWDEMADFVESQSSGDRNDVELHNKTSFYQAVHCVHSEKYTEALSLIESTRKKLSYAVSTLLSENYSRAYRGIVSMQILSELEEVIEFKQAAAAQAAVELAPLIISADNGTAPSTPQHKPSIRGMPSTPSLANMESAMKFSNKSGRLDLQHAKESLMKKWRARLKWAPNEIDVYRQILVSSCFDTHAMYVATCSSHICPYICDFIAYIFLSLSLFTGWLSQLILLLHIS